MEDVLLPPPRPHRTLGYAYALLVEDTATGEQRIAAPISGAETFDDLWPSALPLTEERKAALEALGLRWQR